MVCTVPRLHTGMRTVPRLHTGVVYTPLCSTPVLLPHMWYSYCEHQQVYTAKASWYSRTANLVDVLHLVDGMYHPYYTDLLRTPPGVHSQGILVLTYRQV